MAGEWRNLQKSALEYQRIFRAGHSIIVFDTETTGLGKTAKIIEFAAVRFYITENGLVETGKMDLYINPEMKLPEKIIEITGITDADLSRCRTEWEEAPYVFDFLASANYWAAYNCKFDLRMLKQMSDRTGIRYTERECIDVLEMARDHLGTTLENNKLGTVTEYLFPEENFQFHCAIDDVRATARCMRKFIGMYRTLEPDEGRIQTKLNWASYWINPNNPIQKRIKLNLPVGEYGDIYWDVIKNMWSCKSSSSAQKLFRRLDLANLESQVLQKYAWRYQVNNMSDLAKAWGADKRKKEKDAS